VKVQQKFKQKKANAALVAFVVMLAKKWSAQRWRELAK